ncbi:hypothetical protein ACMXYW_02905 [Neptuniibacter sp. QD48_55]|uniref:hypothetical protein n=1 Tax=Neptuniibacter sp. QD48_55 TaxID=3398212 RepID=UPI0039F4686A
MKIYLVGGAVRDKLLDFPVYDKDWVVVGSSPQEMIEQGFQPVGQDFPVFIHPQSGEEYALARTERKSGKGYTGFEYNADKAITLEEDLLRRDLTINAMAMDNQGIIHDPYKGQEDLNQKILRHVSPAFSEDPLRVLRVARFAARYHHLGFSVADETLALMRELAKGDELEHLTPERVWKEFERALTEPSPWVFLELLQKTEAIQKVLPELKNAISKPDWATNFIRSTQTAKDADCRFACLTALDNEIVLTAFCDRLRTQKSVKELASQCQQQHKNLSQFDKLSAEDKLQTIQALDLIRRPQRLEKLLICVDALHSEPDYKSLAGILDSINQIQPANLIKQGFKGPELGKEIQRLRLDICNQDH